MSIAAQLLSLRRDQTSSVQRLQGAIEWQRAATHPGHHAARHFAVLQAVDQVLLNVAAHASAQQILFADSAFALLPPGHSPNKSASKPTPGRNLSRQLHQLTFAAFFN